MRYEHIWYLNNVKIIDTVSLDGQTMTISQRTEPNCRKIKRKRSEDEVTHGVFFGENIKRVYNALFK